MSDQTRKIIFIVFSMLSVLSIYFIFQLKFSFDFEQFFPDGDPDLEFFQEFIKDFETDDNFMLIAVKREAGAFEQSFLEDFHDFTLQTRKLPYVEESQSLTKFSYPLKTPFAITTIPAIHIKDPSKYKRDKEKILKDERFVHNLISEDAKTLVVAIKTIPSIQLLEAREFMDGLDELISKYDFEEYHYLGRPYFQKELVAMQQREILVSASVSGFLVTLVMFFIFRRFLGIMVALVSIGLGMLLFMGLLGATGRELNAMAALYPVLMIIVGTSDVVHIMSKYIDELRKGNSKYDSIKVTIREIGMATLLTSVTTAIGFGSLATSKVVPIRDFGINAAIGVLVAYVTVVFFTSALLSLFKTEQIIRLKDGASFWDKYMGWFDRYTKNYPARVGVGALVVLGIAFFGMSLVTTNYNIISNMPTGSKITEDFMFFEEEFAGFRPMEFAVFAKQDYKADDFEVLQEVEKLEDELRREDAVRAIISVTALYKSINQMMNANKSSEYKLPEDKQTFERYKRLAEKVPQQSFNVLLSKDKDKAKYLLVSKIWGQTRSNNYVSI